MDSEITRLYRLRFQKELATRNKIWRVLCKEFFQKYIRPSDTVCDLGAGFCEFINHIRAKNKVAIDINTETKKYAKNGVKVITCSSTKLPKDLFEKVDLVFASNFFEHLPSKEDLAKTLIQIKRILKDGGRILILMPNIRYVGASYWDFLDHQLPLSEKSMTEALELNDFEIVEIKKKFLPYSTKGRLPKNSFLVSLYLRLTPLHLLFGKQSFIVAKKR